ncbi:hypothetical protein [Flavobacterium gyeonganense]|uniref:Uncharacterized protein n=1 Tax=Flavobacterium gyeonganense TaxID=1310418 RepID=A0ABV5H9D3_9FLAO|nr:hypothetical protein [Flavobacterium gyeonganense]
MINKEKAYLQVRKILLDMEKDIGLKLDIDDKYYEEFFDFVLVAYNSFEYLHNGNTSYLLVGNLPFIVNNNEGNIYKLLNSECDLDNIKFKELLKKGFLEQIE